jgi:CHAT domain-containing protein
MGDPDFDADLAAVPSDQPTDSRTTTRPGRYTTRSTDLVSATLKEVLLSPLPATREEIEGVMLGWVGITDEPATLYFGPDATENRFKVEAPGYRVVYLATHAYYLGSLDQPDGLGPNLGSRPNLVGEHPLLLSGLFLAGANRQGDDHGASDGGDCILTAYEVSALDMEGTDVIVLSACETGLGKVESGEGVYGLRRAFLMAGARTVVSALWPMSDIETSLLMSGLYEKTTESMPESMRRIQLDRINELRASGEVDHPFSWAGFVVMGDWK